MNRTDRKCILLADNNADFCRSLTGLLEFENYVVQVAPSVSEAKDFLDTNDCDLVLVDLRLTEDEDTYDISGFDVAKRAQELSIPCMFISAFTTMEYQRLVLRSRGVGPLALDFIEKQHGPEAVLDALRIFFSRTIVAPVLESSPDLSIEVDQGLARIKGEVLELSNFQYALLAYLYQKRGAVASSQELLKAIYNEELTLTEANTDRRLERLVDRLRDKIEKDPSNPRFLVTVHGRGYRLALDS